jgi:hypothetical protein
MIPETMSVNPAAQATTDPIRMLSFPVSPSSHIHVQLDIEWTFHLRIGHGLENLLLLLDNFLQNY